MTFIVHTHIHTRGREGEKDKHTISVYTYVYLHIYIICIFPADNDMHRVHTPTRQRERETKTNSMGVATIIRLLKITGLFRRILSLSLGSFVEETYHIEEPTNRSRPIRRRLAVYIAMFRAYAPQNCLQTRQIAPHLHKRQTLERQRQTL